jgi:hypothetical protein
MAHAEQDKQAQPKFRGGFAGALTDKKPTLAKKVACYVSLSLLLEAEEQGLDIEQYIGELKRRIRTLQEVNEENKQQIEALMRKETDPHHDHHDRHDRDRGEDPKLQQGSK